MEEADFIREMRDRRMNCGGKEEEERGRRRSRNVCASAHLSQFDVAIVVGDGQPPLGDGEIGNALPDLIRSRFRLLIDVFQVQFDFLLSGAQSLSVLMMGWSHLMQAVQEQRVPESDDRD
jgi:hypothetical protein